jgi:hypothetical protein
MRVACIIYASLIQSDTIHHVIGAFQGPNNCYLTSNVTWITFNVLVDYYLFQMEAINCHNS